MDQLQIVQQNNSLFSPDKVELYKKNVMTRYMTWMIQAIYLGLRLVTQLKFVVTLQLSCHLRWHLVNHQKLAKIQLTVVLESWNCPVMTLPCAVPKSKSKRKPAINAKAVCITNDSVLEDLKRKEDEKIKEKKKRELRERLKRKWSNWKKSKRTLLEKRKKLKSNVPWMEERRLGPEETVHKRECSFMPAQFRWRR